MYSEDRRIPLYLAVLGRIGTSLFLGGVAISISAFFGVVASIIYTAYRTSQDLVTPLPLIEICSMLIGLGAIIAAVGHGLGNLLLDHEHRRRSVEIAKEFGHEPPRTFIDLQAGRLAIWVGLALIIGSAILDYHGAWIMEFMAGPLFIILGLSILPKDSSRLK